MTRRDEALHLLDEARDRLERARDQVSEVISKHGQPPNRAVALSYADAADTYEVAIDALIEALGPSHVPPEALNKMREARWNAFRWSHESIPGLGEYWSTPRYRIAPREAKRRLADAGVTKRGQTYRLDGREIRLPGYLVPTPLGSGLYGRLGLMSDEDGGEPNLWFIEVSQADLYPRREGSYRAGP